MALAHGAVRQLRRSHGEGRGKAQAESLRRAKTDSLANRVVYGSVVERVPVTLLLRDDAVLVSAGEVITGDGEIVEGVASVDESAITGEAAPVIRVAEMHLSARRRGATGDVAPARSDPRSKRSAGARSWNESAISA